MENLSRLVKKIALLSSASLILMGPTYHLTTYYLANSKIKKLESENKQISKQYCKDILEYYENFESPFIRFLDGEDNAAKKYLDSQKIKK